MRKIIFLIAFSWLLAAAALAAPKAELWDKWQARDETSKAVVDHSAWGMFLGRYVITQHPSGINRVAYSSVSKQDRTALAGYLEAMQGVTVSALNGAEQKAYWINLYNALTVRLVLDDYPVKSIKDLPKSAWFSFGPWDVKYLEIEGEKLSLNDIEHRILRPVWKDNRLHYALNCASLGCPNLQPQAFTSANTEELLEKAAREYLGHPRGATLVDGKLILSSIYDWFAEDFGGTREGLLAHVIRYAPPDLAAKLTLFNGKIGYVYDWRLNE